MHSNYVIEQRLYTDVKCNEPGPFYCCGSRCSDIVFKLSNRTDIAHGCKMYCTGHFYCCGWRNSGVLKLFKRTELHMDVKCDAWQAKDNTLMRMRMTDDDHHPLCTLYLEIVMGRPSSCKNPRSAHYAGLTSASSRSSKHDKIE
jgi:hypothetical protein